MRRVDAVIARYAALRPLEPAEVELVKGTMEYQLAALGDAIEPLAHKAEEVALKIGEALLAAGRSMARKKEPRL